MDPADIEGRLIEENRFTREIHFKNEAFFIGVLHAVGGGSLVAGLHQIDKLLLLGSPAVVLAFLTLVAGALVCAVLAAALKHSYKMYDMKAQATDAPQLRTDYSGLANSRLELMRRMMTASVALLIAAYVVLLVSAWIQYFADPGMLNAVIGATRL